MSGLRLFTSGVAMVLVPGMAHATTGMTSLDILRYADPTMQLLMLALAACAVTAIVVAVRKVLAGPGLSGGSAYLQALRLGGPLIGLLGATYNALMINIGIANFGRTSYPVIAPFVAEAILLLALGLITGIVAVICNWIVEARIDRAVLRP